MCAFIYFIYFSIASLLGLLSIQVVQYIPEGQLLLILCMLYSGGDTELHALVSGHLVLLVAEQFQQVLPTLEDRTEKSVEAVSNDMLS